MRLWPLLLLALILIAASAQNDSAPKPATSTVTGHVYCADTNTPARLASVMLEPVRAVEEAGSHQGDSHGERLLLTAVQTTLDGSFVIPKVRPGTYYVVAYKTGYLSPLGTFPTEVLDHPSEEDRARIAATVPIVKVEAGLPASLDIRLERGAAISGTALFDDGSPAADLAVHALIRHGQGQKQSWTALPPTPFKMDSEVHTDDLGRYRLVGLAPRDYIVQIDLELQDRDFGVEIGGAGGSRQDRSIARIAFYSGSATRKRDATSFKLAAGDEHNGEDITIPLSKLHTLSGELLSAHDGHVLNSGTVSLRDPDDQSEVESSKVGRADGKFHLLFIPEGNYTLHVSNAADVTYEDVPNPPGSMPPSFETTQLIHGYGVADQPINVHDDIPNLVLSVPERGHHEANRRLPIKQNGTSRVGLSRHTSTRSASLLAFVVEEPLVRNLSVLPVTYGHLLHLHALAALEGDLHLPLGKGHIPVHRARGHLGAMECLHRRHELLLGLAILCLALARLLRVLLHHHIVGVVLLKRFHDLS
jgi:hypothetical protein